MYVPPEQMNTKGVSFERGDCFKVAGTWDDLHQLAMQIKSRYVAPTCTIVLVSGKQWSDEPSELLIIGQVEHNAYRLVEQRINEGLNVEIVYGKYFRGSFVYQFKEWEDKEIDEAYLNLEIEDHPF